ncbi:Ribonuclease H [Pseudoalteromonas sp. CIP111854]|uniref:Ribonuclease H n=1 Tax=Pseudoalteromonas holothuriae TaxID=2963714 RepID=A0A9W4QY41_9GAMM|nr:ribonuclease H family protein [Pseudoalteromonas sp. CIP111854]CAH9058473.1 Ribonuclease H [Pseudoalteromonas sp. CIP111854]
MAKKYYVIWTGRETGIFTTWDKCKSLVDGFAGAKYKSYSSLEEAQSAFSGKLSLTPLKAKQRAKTNKSNITSLCQKEIDAMPFDIKIYTDGACDPNPGKAGTGLAVYKQNELSELWYGLYQAIGTNNTAELRGLAQALLLAKEYLASNFSVVIFCDSRYSIDCVTKWAAGWEKKGWTKAGGEIKNLDIIKSAYMLYQEVAEKIHIYHVNGHVGIEGNELADRMSIVAIETQNKALSLFSETDDISKILALRSG